MFQHRWFFQGIVQSVIDGRTLQLWIDLGFEIWKIVVVKFNRLQVKTFFEPGQVEKSKAHVFLESNLLRKKVFVKVFRKKDRNGYPVYYAEIYTQSSEIPVERNAEDMRTLRDINVALKSDSRPRSESLININDLMVTNGLAEYTEYSKTFIRDGSSREHAKVPTHFENREEIENQSDSSRGGSSPERSNSYGRSNGFRDRFPKRVFNGVSEK